MRPIEKKEASREACVFTQTSGVTFTDGDAGVDDNRFKIIAYSGGVISNHWFWGNLAFDLAGIRFNKKKTPVLEEHDRASRIGFTEKQSVNGNIIVEGKFLGNSNAQRLRSDMKDGFPMQASIYLPPDVIEHVKDGESVDVNGHKLKGPGTVFRKGKIREVSMCTLGADSNTQSKAFAEGSEPEIQFDVMGKGREMDREITLAVRESRQSATKPVGFEAAVDARVKETGCRKGDAIRFVVHNQPDLHANFLQELRTPPKVELTEFWGRVKEYRERIGCNEGDAIRFCVDKYPELVDFWDAVRHHIKEASCSQADAIHFVVQKYPELHVKFLQELREKEEARKKAEWSRQQTSNRRTFSEAGGFWAAVDARVKESGCSKGDAIRFIVHNQPELHKAFLESQKRKVEAVA